LRPEDFPELRTLARESPDTGLVPFASEFIVPPDEADRALGTDAATYIARIDGAMAGTAKVTYGEIQYEGAVRGGALLGDLMVHPRFRRRGVATRLALHRIAAAEERLGADAVLLADIQRGNQGSLRNAAKWQTAASRPFVAVTVPTSPGAPTPRGSFRVREAEPGDLEEIARGIAECYGDANFHRPQQAEDLAAWLGRGEDPLRRYLVALDASGAIAAGLGLTHLHRCLALRIGPLPLFARLMNLVARELPPDGMIRAAEVDLLFHRPGRAAAAIELWQAAGGRWAADANALMLCFDPAGPLAELAARLRLRRGVAMQAAVRAPVPPDPARPLVPWLF